MKTDESVENYFYSKFGNYSSEINDFEDLDFFFPCMFMHIFSLRVYFTTKLNYFRLMELLKLVLKMYFYKGNLSTSMDLNSTIYLYKILVKKNVFLQNLLSALELDPDETKKWLAENNRKITVLRVNERSLTRQYTTLLEIERRLRKENEKLKSEITHMETAVEGKIGHLQRFKVFFTFTVWL